MARPRQNCRHQCAHRCGAPRRPSRDSRKRQGPRTRTAAASRSGFAGVSSIAKNAQSFIAARRRPILLGIALFALATTLAVFELRGGRLPAIQKSELAAPVAAPAPLAALPDDSAAAKTSANVDYTPSGAISAAPPAAAARSKPAPTELIAAIPAGLPQLLRDAAANGDPAAETELALRYVDGRTIARDPVAASKWFEQAALQGSAVAQYRPAALLEKGAGIPRDIPQARSRYLKAATAGNARAMHNLAVLYAADAGAGKPGLRRSFAMVPPRRRTRHSRQSVQPRRALWPRPRRRAGSRTVLVGGSRSPRNRAMWTRARSATKWRRNWI